ncbi:FapA family protein [Desulfovibrio mangrovi]|uniref:FapA family protein n=1 Tax=Desulfovibrio mangrovi TaxID=2976983 RepID=UPI0022450A97|nr:FapA family protein [Desulfovibrio mangrovi]UZP68898.1 FapA family protein [Desulfovibrio mangrovi]
MKVGVARYIPPRGNGRPLTIERIQKLLREAGVKVPVSIKGVEKLLECIASGSPIDRIVIARGLQPENGTDACIVPYGNTSFPVFPGQPIGNLVPATPPKSGMRVDGTEFPPQSPHKPREITIPADCNCYLDEGSNEIVPSVYGLVSITDVSINIRPLVRISEDRLTVTATLYYRDMLAKPVSAERVRLMLQAMNVPDALIDIDAITSALARSERTGSPEADVVLARGRLPLHGVDGFVEMLQREDDAAAVGKAASDGSIDFRNRGIMPSVQSGETVAVIHPPTAGISGMDVYGETLPAEMGKAANVTLDKSVVLAQDGCSAVAQISGLAQYVGGVLSVQEVVEVKGDVDFSSGNVQVATGSVKVKGAVLSGFSVKAPGAVVVGEAVESARIIAGGNIEVSGGIVMQGKGFVRCGGNVTAKFISEAMIEAREDVIVHDSILHSTIMCGGMVLATSGRGRIQGGSITCRKGIRALEVGNALGTPTNIILAASSKATRDIEKERDSVKEALAKLSAKFGEAPAEEILMHARPDQYKVIEAAMGLRDKLTERLDTLREILLEARQKAAERMKDTTIKVTGVVHPGTVVTIGEAMFTVSSPLQAVTFRYIPESRTIEAASA